MASVALASVVRELDLQLADHIHRQQASRAMVQTEMVQSLVWNQRRLAQITQLAKLIEMICSAKRRDFHTDRMQQLHESLFRAELSKRHKQREQHNRMCPGHRRTEAPENLQGGEESTPARRAAVDAPSPQRYESFSARKSISAADSSEDDIAAIESYLTQYPDSLPLRRDTAIHTVSL